MSDSNNEKVSLFLNEPVLESNGLPVKDAGQEKRSIEHLSKLTVDQISQGLPIFTKGVFIINIINNLTNCKDMEELSKYQRLIVKVKNKTLTEKGEWVVTKDDLLDLKGVFDKVEMNKTSVNLHGQLYNEILDLLVKINSKS